MTLGCCPLQLLLLYSIRLAQSNPRLKRYEIGIHKTLSAVQCNTEIWNDFVHRFAHSNSAEVSLYVYVVELSGWMSDESVFPETTPAVDFHLLSLL
jgi:hypothetical protein